MPCADLRSWALVALAVAQDAAHTAQRSMRDVRSSGFSARREQRAQKRSDTAPKTRFVFGSTDRTRTDSYHTPPTRNNSTTKQALGEAARVRGHELAQRLDVNFTLGQRVKLRRSEPTNAALEFRA